MARASATVLVAVALASSIGLVGGPLGQHQHLGELLLVGGRGGADARPQPFGLLFGVGLRPTGVGELSLGRLGPLGGDA